MNKLDNMIFKHLNSLNFDQEEIFKSENKFDKNVFILHVENIFNYNQDYKLPYIFCENNDDINIYQKLIRKECIKITHEYNIDDIIVINDKIDDYFNYLRKTFFNDSNNKLKILFDIFNNISSPICIIDKNFKFIYVNKESARLWDYSAEFLFGKSVFDIYPNINNLDYGHKLKRSFDNQEIIETEVFYEKYNHWFSVTFYPSEDYLSIFSKEITKEKIAQENLSRTIKELNEYSYIVSHDLQEPLRIIKSFLQLLEKKYTSNLEAKALEYIGYAVEGSERMQSLINDLLEYSRIETRKTPLTSKSFSEISNLIYRQNKNIDKESIKINFLHSDERVNVDLPQLLLIFNHLIDNSIKYSQPGLGCEINISCKQVNNYKCISISDNGIGIQEEYFEKIVLPFKRLHNRLQIPGNGIGLAICKKVMIRHNGKLEFSSKVNEGTTVNLYFPT